MTRSTIAQIRLTEKIVLWLSLYQLISSIYRCGLTEIQKRLTRISIIYYISITSWNITLYAEHHQFPPLGFPEIIIKKGRTSERYLYYRFSTLPNSLRNPFRTSNQLSTFCDQPMRFLRPFPTTIVLDSFPPRPQFLIQVSKRSFIRAFARYCVWRREVIA